MGTHLSNTAIPRLLKMENLVELATEMVADGQDKDPALTKYCMKTATTIFTALSGKDIADASLTRVRVFDGDTINVPELRRDMVTVTYVALTNNFFDPHCISSGHRFIVLQSFDDCRIMHAWNDDKTVFTFRQFETAKEFHDHRRVTSCQDFKTKWKTAMSVLRMPAGQTKNDALKLVKELLGHVVTSDCCNSWFVQHVIYSG